MGIFKPDPQKMMKKGDIEGLTKALKSKDPSVRGGTITGGWPVCLIRKDYVYDESETPDLTSTKLNMHDWLNIIANKKFELI